MTEQLLQDQYCQNCRFWLDGIEHHAAVGDCRKRPPTISAHGDRNGIEGRGVWPKTFSYDWCGEWVLKPEDEEA